MTNSKLWLQHTGGQCSADIFFLFFTVYCWFLMLPDSVRCFSWRRDSSHVCREPQAAVAHYSQAKRGDHCISNFTVSLFFKFSTVKTLSHPFLNHLLHLPSHFHSGVAVKSYPIYRHSESIMFRSFQRFCRRNKNSQYSAHCEGKRTGAVLTDHVFPNLISLAHCTINSLCIKRSGSVRFFLVKTSAQGSSTHTNRQY